MNLINDPLHDKRSEEEDGDDVNNHDELHRAAPNDEAAGDQSDAPEGKKAHSKLLYNTLC